MGGKKKKSKIKLKSLAPYMMGAGIGLIIGLAMVFFRVGDPADVAADAADASAQMAILAGAIAGASFFAALLLHIIVHEAGHLICGLFSGYQFVSFTVAGMMFVKEDGKLKIKRFGIAGAGGQCLMSLPALENNTYPFVLYNLGGGLMNFLFSGIAAALFFAVKDSFIFAVEVFVPFALIGVILGASNLLPLKMGGLSTDGRNILLIKKSEQTRRAFWILLTVNAQMSLGSRLKDLPAEWFEFADDSDFNDSVLGNIAAIGLGRLMDLRDFDAAKALAQAILDKGVKLIEMLKNEVRCELLFFEIMGEPCPERQAQIESLYTPELKKYIKASGTQLSKRRLTYAYEKLVSLDAQKAAKALEAFNKTCRTYPFTGDRETERELMALIDRTAAPDQAARRG
ncbi:MAG: hypothetical protein FWG93_00760 [Oscillospiraceae bacterium]|nr:hypothetical protein [Oscillospiraceae bacterium]